MALIEYGDYAVFGMIVISTGKLQNQLKFSLHAKYLRIGSHLGVCMNNKTQNLSLIKIFLPKIRAKQITAHLHVQLRFIGSTTFLSMHLKYAFA